MCEAPDAPKQQFSSDMFSKKKTLNNGPEKGLTRSRSFITRDITARGMMPKIKKPKNVKVGTV